MCVVQVAAYHQSKQGGGTCTAFMHEIGKPSIVQTAFDLTPRYKHRITKSFAKKSI
jgi:hypothetical protein